MNHVIVYAILIVFCVGVVFITGTICDVVRDFIKRKTKSSFPVADVKAWAKEKYSLLSSSEIGLLQKNKYNCSFDEWYEAMLAYVDGLGGDWDKSMVADIQIGYWNSRYVEGNTTTEAFKDAFIEQ